MQGSFKEGGIGSLLSINGVSQNERSSESFRGFNAGGKPGYGDVVRSKSGY